ncbi:MAG: hypothetical protein M0R73_08690 [Dehalococcoidia bacterium]|nr:hypothetical protein [Dehalococcoidia bacterium]
MTNPTSEVAVDRIMNIPEHAGASMCFGEPVRAGDRTAIPVAEVSYTLGLGWGGGRDAETSGNGGGAGGAARTRAVAVIDVSPDAVRVIPIEDFTQIRLASIAFIGTTTALVARSLLKLVRG